MKAKLLGAVMAVLFLAASTGAGAPVGPKKPGKGKQAKAQWEMLAAPEPKGGIQIPQLAGGEVTMPWVEFAKLLGAIEKQKQENPPPVAYAVESAKYACAVDEKGKKASVQASFSVRVMQQGWTTVELLRGDVAVDSFETSGAPVALSSGYGQVNAIVSGPASFEITMKLGRTVGTEQGMSSLWIDGPMSASTNIECTIPGKGLEVEVQPGLVESQSEADGKVTVAGSVFGGGSFTVRWWEQVQVPEAEKKDLPVKMYGEVHTLLRIGEGMLRGIAQVDYSILQAGVQELKILVPEDISILDVKGENLAGWEVRESDGQKVLHAFLSYKVKNATSLTIAWDRNIGKTTAVVDVPRLVLLDVERETGAFGVEVLTNIEVRLEKLENMAQVDVVELTHPVMWSAEHPILLGFKYLKHPYSLVLDVKKHQDVPVLVATVDIADFTTLLTSDGKLLTRVLLSMRNNMKQFLKVELPEGSELWSTYVDNEPVKPGKDEQGRILVPLEKSQSGGATMANFPVEIIYLTKTQELEVKGTRRVELCKIDLPVTQLQWSLYLPEKFKYKKFKGNVDECLGEFAPVPEAAPLGAWDVIEQNAMGNVQMEDRNQSINMDEMMSYIAPQQAMSKGVLPVKLSVPKQGSLKRFVKLLVIDEAASVEFAYKKLWKYRD